MPRHPRTDIDLLRQEVRAMELLADETQVMPDKLQEYWQVSAELITLSADVEEFITSHPNAGYEDPEMLALKRRVRQIAASLAALAPE